MLKIKAPWFLRFEGGFVLSLTGACRRISRRVTCFITGDIFLIHGDELVQSMVVLCQAV
jgi:hypothetical protein